MGSGGMADTHCEDIEDWPLIYIGDGVLAGSIPASSTTQQLI